MDVKVPDMPGELAPDRRNLRVSHEDRDQVVERLQVAAADGRLTAEELDERVGSALTARTYGDLDVLLTDLPAVPGTAPAPAPEVKDLVRLETTHGNIRRDGRWAVPRHLDIEARHGNVVIDFTEAIISESTLDLSVSLRHGSLVLIAPPDVTVDLDSLVVGHSNIRNRAHGDPDGPVRLLVTVSGNLRHANVTVRRPRGAHRSFWAWLFRRPLPARELPAR
jgi:hypothetical protein